MIWAQKFRNPSKLNWYLFSFYYIKRKFKIFSNIHKILQDFKNHSQYQISLFMLSKLISEAGDDQKSLFSSVSRLLHRKPEVLYPVCSSDSILANNFADYFETKIHNIRKELENH